MPPATSSTGSFDVVVGDSTGPTITRRPGRHLGRGLERRRHGRHLRQRHPASDAVGGAVGVTLRAGVAAAPSPSARRPSPARPPTLRATRRRRRSGSRSRSTSRPPTPTAPPPTCEWGEPISGGSLSANQGRTIPLKFRLFIDGVERDDAARPSCRSRRAAADHPRCRFRCRSTAAAGTGHLDTSAAQPGLLRRDGDDRRHARRARSTSTSPAPIRRPSAEAEAEEVAQTNRCAAGRAPTPSARTAASLLPRPFGILACGDAARYSDRVDPRVAVASIRDP